LTLHLFAALAEKKRAMIAARTKAALAALAIASIKALADHQAANVLPVIRGYRRLAA